MIKRKLTQETLRNWAFGQLSLAQHQFAMNPNGSNWHEVIRAMFVYQQVSMIPYIQIDAPALLTKLAPMNQSVWGDVISMATVGMLVRDAVKA